MTDVGFQLRPLNTTEILDEAFSLYRRNFGLLFGITFVPYMLAQLVSGGLAIGAMQAEEPEAMIGLMLAAGGVGLLLLTLAQEIAGAAACAAVSDRILGNKTSIAASYGRLMRRSGGFLVYLILKTLAITGGIVLCCVGAIVVQAFLFVSICAFVIEGRGAADSLTRSWNLTKAHFWRALVLLILVFVLSGVISGAISGVFGVVTAFVPGTENPSSPAFALTTMLEAASQGLALAFIAPIIATSITLFYYDLRVRKEAFDLQILAENLVDRG